MSSTSSFCLLWLFWVWRNQPRSTPTSRPCWKMGRTQRKWSFSIASPAALFGKRNSGDVRPFWSPWKTQTQKWAACILWETGSLAWRPAYSITNDFMNGRRNRMKGNRSSQKSRDTWSETTKGNNLAFLKWNQVLSGNGPNERDLSRKEGHLMGKWK